MSAQTGLAEYILATPPLARTAIVAADGTRSLTYQDLIDQSSRGAAGLIELGVKREQVVALHLPNVPEFAPALLAVVRVGAVALPCSPLAPQDELAAQLSLTRAAVVITTPALESLARAAAERTNVKHVICSLPTHRGNALDQRRVNTNDPAIIAFSSGTTGTPKGAVLTHGGIVANLRQAAEALPLDTNDVVLALAPFAHVIGLWGLLLRGMAAGATVVTMPRFAPEEFLDVLSRHRVTQTIVPPSIIDFLATSPAVDRHDLSALRVLYVGGAGAAADVERACANRLGCVVAQGYGMTEGGPMIAVNPIADNNRARYGSAGIPLVGVQIRIVDPANGTVLPVGATGEIHVWSPALMAGYLNDPESTALTIDETGWLRTGDLGYLDDEGYLWIVDRLKDLLKYKGHQVAPAEVEAVLRRHSAVSDAAVVGMPDPRAGELPVAFVSLRTPVTPDELIAFVAARVSIPKRIHDVRVVDQIPRSAAGKILRRALRGQLLRRTPPMQDPARVCATSARLDDSNTTDREIAVTQIPSPAQPWP
jgi:acyl-CoA synthetase (AMP-forming)/AMP-acid ligase II